MKEEIIRLLKSVGIALLCFGVMFLVVLAFVRFTDVAAIVTIVLLFIYVVWRIYKYGEL